MQIYGNEKYPDVVRVKNAKRVDVVKTEFAVVIMIEEADGFINFIKTRIVGSESESNFAIGFVIVDPIVAPL